MSGGLESGPSREPSVAINVLRIVWGVSGWALFAAFSLIGLMDLILAIPEFFHSSAPDGEPRVPPITLALEGLEKLFLAPLAYLTLLCVFRYVDSLHAGHVPESATGALASMHEVKSQIVGLIIAVTATEMVRRILSPQELLYSVAAGGLGLILVLTLYTRTLNRVR